MLPYRSVLVTGARGFVGQYLVEALRVHLASDAVLLCPGRRAGATGDRAGDGAGFDLLDGESIDRFLDKHRPDLVFHLAAQSSVGVSAGGAADTWRTNVCGTLNLAQGVAAIVPTATFVFTSSSEVYGAAFKTGVVDEHTPPAPLSCYARTKRAAEDLLSDVLTPTNRCVVFRPSNHSGIGQDVRFVLPAFADQIARIEAGLAPPVVRVGSLTAERDFLDVRDVVEAYLGVLKRPGPTMRETLNIASGQVRPIRYLLDELVAMSRVTVTIEQDPDRMRSSEVPSARIAAARLTARTGWRPRHSIREMIVDVLEDRRRQCFPSSGR